MKKTLYICGDSFCSSDPAYGDNWTDMLEKKYPNIDIINLSSFGASNYLIYLQVKQALEKQCNYLIYHATSSIRQEFIVATDNALNDSSDRYYQINQDNLYSMVSASWLNPEKNLHKIFNNNKIQKIKEFFTEFIDLPVLIEKNYITISYTLSLLKSNVNLEDWAWTQGGFEHSVFSNACQWDFSLYQSQHYKDINLWDYYDPNLKRPYYHITDKHLLENVCNGYATKLNLDNV